MSNSRDDRFDEAFRSWAAIEPETQASEAARHLISRLPERRPTSRWVPGWQLKLGIAAIGLVLALFLALLARWQPPVPVSPSGEIVPPPLQDDVLLLWLDNETPLYLTVGPPAVKGGS